jgi:hypothetical protein
MIFYAGTRLAGRVEAHRGTFVVTEFLHLYYLPILPTRSYLVLEARSDAGAARRLPIDLHPVSILAGYLRAWATLGAGMCLVLACLTFGNPASLAGGMAAIVLTGVALWAWRPLGRLSVEERAQRDVYAALTQIPADVALLARTFDPFRFTLHANVAEGARSMMATDYRSTIDPTKEWAEVALNPTMRNRAFLEACFTLSRLDWARAKGATRAKLAGQHRRIWQRMRAL